MKIVAVGGRSFVAGFRLAGINGIEVGSSDEALKTIYRLMEDEEIGLILLSDEVAKPLRRTLAEIRTKKAIPIIYEVTSPGSKVEKMEYMDLLKQILGVTI